MDLKKLLIIAGIGGLAHYLWAADKKQKRTVPMLAPPPLTDELRAVHPLFRFPYRRAKAAGTTESYEEFLYDMASRGNEKAEIRAREELTRLGIDWNARKAAEFAAPPPSPEEPVSRRDTEAAVRAKLQEFIARGDNPLEAQRFAPSNES